MWYNIAIIIFIASIINNSYMEDNGDTLLAIKSHFKDVVCTYGYYYMHVCVWLWVWLYWICNVDYLFINITYVYYCIVYKTISCAHVYFCCVYFSHTTVIFESIPSNHMCALPLWAFVNDKKMLKHTHNTHTHTNVQVAIMVVFALSLFLAHSGSRAINFVG